MTDTRISLRQLAEKLKLSPATVSRALNGFPEVNEKTRKRVAAAAAELGYFPNRSAKRLANGRVGAFGIVMPTSAGSHFDPLFAEFLGGLCDKSIETGVEIIIQPTSEAGELDTYRRAIAEQTVDGFIVSSPKEKDGRVLELIKLGVPFVLHGRTNIGVPHDYFDIDNEAAFYRAAKLLMEYGHKRIALLGGISDQQFTIDRLAGTRRALADGGLELHPHNVFMGEMTEQTGHLAGLHYLSMAPHERPTAFLCMSLFVALGLGRASKTKNLSIPGDFSVIVHDDRAPYLRSEHFDPPLSALQSSIRRAGVTIADMLHHRIQNPNAPVISEVAPVDLILRSSVSSPSS